MFFANVVYCSFVLFNNPPFNYTLMKHLSLFALLLPFVLLFTACGDDDEPTGPPRGDQTIAQIVQDTEGLTVLNGILARESFVSLRTQLGSGEYTLLAPNDQAFTNLLTALGVPDLELVDEGILGNILDYHILPNQTVQLNQLDSSAITLSQQTVNFTRGDSVTLNAAVRVQPETTIVSPEALYASNGVVHVIDEVLLPARLQATAPTFGTVAGLLDVLSNVQQMNSIITAAQLNTLLADAARSFTLIAPVDPFLITNDINLSNNGLLFFSGNQIIEGVIDVANPPRKVTTLVGVPLYLSVAGEGAVYVNGQGVVDVGAQASNGQVLYTGGIIDAPQDLSGGLGAVSEATGQSFSIFQAALSQTGLALSGEKTIFAPTDSAFIRAGLTASVDSASRIDNALLAAILNNHIVEGVTFFRELQSGAIATAGGNQITATITETTNGVRATLSDTNAENQDANIVFVDEYVYFGDLTDVEELTEVGVVHAIDQLLLP